MKSLADLAGIDRVRLPLEPPCPEVPAGLDPVFLLDASTSLERSLLTAWVERCGFPNARVVDLASSRIRRYRHSSPAVGHIVGEEDSAWLIPLRVAWLPTERLGRRTVSWMDLLKVGDPRDPRPLREYLILWMYPDRVRILVGEGATAPRLRADHASDHRPLTEFVTRRAWLALDRQERAERGDRYKIPRFVSEDIASDPTFEQRAIELGADRGLSPRRALARARYYLREIAASHSPFLIDLIANLIHWVIRRGYGTIHYDRQATKQIAQLGRSHFLVYLPSHKSNLDRLSFQFMLWENDMPPNHTAG
ncbi:MAG TPA: hypothetical protein VK088_00315, partial [Acidimicrobiia bacterium]|nr:hypothetical protein [Acidimicrobiia bacterium]